MGKMAYIIASKSWSDGRKQLYKIYKNTIAARNVAFLSNDKSIEGDNAKELTPEDYCFINTQCRSIAKFDCNGVSDYELRLLIYMLGLYASKKFTRLGFPRIFLPIFRRSLAKSKK